MTMNARKTGGEVNIAVVNAPDPVVLLAAAMSFDENIDELTIAAALHEKLYGKPLRLTRMPNGVLAPADAEYVLYGRITGEDDDEGPYVDITGTVDDVRQEPVIEIEGVIHRDDPIFHALHSRRGRAQDTDGLAKSTNHQSSRQRSMRMPGRSHDGGWLRLACCGCENPTNKRRRSKERDYGCPRRSSQHEDGDDCR